MGDFQPVLGLKPWLKTTNRFNFEQETTFSRWIIFSVTVALIMLMMGILKIV